MKKLVALSIMVVLVLSASAAMASTTDWILLFKAQTGTATLASGIAQAGLMTGATDGYDAGKDAAVTFVSGNAGVGIYEPTWTAQANPPLFGKDVRGATLPQSWDLVLFVGTGYVGSDLQLIWWNATAATQDMPTGLKYTVEVVTDPTGQNSGKSFTLDGTLNGSATAPLGSLSWNAAGVAALKLTPSDAINTGVRLRFTAGPDVVVPEPSSLLALFSGVAGLAGFAIRRKR